MASNPIGYVNETWNPVVGCSPISEGCAHCWARGFAKRLGAQLAEPDPGFPCMKPRFPHYCKVQRWDGHVELVPEQLDVPNHWKKPRRVAVCFMGDLLHENVPDEWLRRIFNVMGKASQHRYMILTKRAERLETIDTNPYRNVEAGVTAENQKRFDERMPHLFRAKVAFRYVSLEPLLGNIDLTPWLWRCPECKERPDALSSRWRWNGVCWEHHHGYPVGHIPCEPAKILDWVVVGPEAGSGRRPCEREWIESIVHQCRTAGVPVWVKAVPCVHKKNRRGDYTDLILKAKTHPLWPTWGVRQLPK